MPTIEQHTATPQELVEQSFALHDHDPHQALELATRAIALATEEGDFDTVAMAHVRAGNAYTSLADYSAALTWYTEGQALLQAVGNRIGEASALIGQGIVHAQLGDMHRALQLFENGREAAEGDPNLQLVAEMDMAVVHTNLGNHDIAIELYQRQAIGFRALGERRDYAIALINLSETIALKGKRLAEQGDASGARETFLTALVSVPDAEAVVTEIANDALMTFCLKTRGIACAGLQRYTEAQEYLEQQGAATRALGQRTEEAEGLMILAQVFLATGKPQRAIAAFSEAAVIAEEIHSDLTASRVHHGLATAWEAAGDYVKSLQHYKRFHQLEIAVRSVDAQRHATVLEEQIRTTEALLEAERLRMQTLELQEQAHRLELAANADSLTGLANRRHLDAAFPDLCHVAVTTQQSVAVTLIDLDGFKDVNDQHSHEAGDAVLRRIGQILNDNVRAGDIAARFGGDEFVVALVTPDTSVVRDICDRIRSAIERAQWDDIAPGIHLTASIGYALSAPDTDLTTLTKRADTALYEAKAAGRNSVQPGSEHTPG
jgi:diguanylate cyclase (GGDEF)-like protein